MVAFQSKKFRSARQQQEFQKTFFGWYEQAIKRNHFLYLGIPMVGSVVLGSILLTNFTAIRYEQRDAKVKELDESDSLKLATINKRKVNLKEEYYRLQGLAEENEDWEQKRVPRLKEEDENVW
ncbi:hypothetical protein PACTADRAFT_45022 [Pachysolen tannophilus NRRL Y-2460]|uniref:Cytochrome c oxidase assembly protein COX16, mitochondrial n=1 Tax=Pachysolen tannophilus NRRL Y-2460 TaxID=669874 RepID=A0A1E4TR96_PACTA|nr:hypothetical protein PACTADRAFT_45022 [Pachysolen tannophilus NRRL Y-2460]